jgi:hypothetical protein
MGPHTLHREASTSSIPPLPHFHDPDPTLSPSSSPISSPSTETPPTLSSSPTNGHHAPKPSIEDRFESISISDESSLPPLHPVTGDAGGSEGSMAEIRAREGASHRFRTSISGMGALMQPLPGAGAINRSSSHDGRSSNSGGRTPSPSVPEGRTSSSSTARQTPSPLRRAIPLPSPTLPSSSHPSPSSPPTISSSQSPPATAPPRRPSTTPSILERVLSRTEDLHHLQAWERQMKLSAQHEAQLKKRALEEAETRRVYQAERLVVWQEKILKGSARSVVAGDAALRKEWWEGVPGRFRGEVWEKTLGNGAALGSGELFHLCAISDDENGSTDLCWSSLVCRLVSRPRSPLPDLSREGRLPSSHARRTREGCCIYLARSQGLQKRWRCGCWRSHVRESAGVLGRLGCGESRSLLAFRISS